MAFPEKRFVDYIMDMKLRCRFEEEIGGECGLAPREVSCLGVLSPRERISAGELASRARLSPSRASRLIASLRGKGMVAEELDAADRRAVSIRLTAEGERLLKKVELKKDECERRLAGAFTPEQARTVRRGLAALSRALEGGEVVIPGTRNFVNRETS